MAAYDKETGIEKMKKTVHLNDFNAFTCSREWEKS